MRRGRRARPPGRPRRRRRPPRSPRSRWRRPGRPRGGRRRPRRLADVEARPAPRCCATARTTTTTSSRAFIKSIRGSRPRRRPVLAGPHARGRRGRPLHRPPAGHPGVSEDVGMADSMGLRGGRCRRPGRRVRRAARGAAQPGPRGDLPGHRAQVATGRRWQSGMAGGRAQRRRRRGARRTCAMPATGERPASATARTTSILTTTRGAGSTSGTCPTAWPAAASTSPPRHGVRSRRCASA